MIIAFTANREITGHIDFVTYVRTRYGWKIHGLKSHSEVYKVLQTAQSLKAVMKLIKDHFYS